MSRSANARHRAAVRPTTPLSDIAQAVTGPVARRAAVAAASSGVVLTLTATASVAGGAPDLGHSRGIVPMATLTNAIQVTTSPTVTVGDDVELSFGSAEVSAEPAEEVRTSVAGYTEPEPVVSAAPAAAAAEHAAPAAAAADHATPATAAEAPSEEQAAAPAEETFAAPAASGLGAQIVEIARRYIGTPYVLGGSTPAAFDCSGFTQYVFAQVGISLPRTSGAQGSIGYRVSAAEAQPGDLVWGPGHVGIYTGNGQHIAARNPSTPLYESPIYLSNPVFIRVTG